MKNVCYTKLLISSIYIFMGSFAVATFVANVLGKQIQDTLIVGVSAGIGVESLIAGYMTIKQRKAEEKARREERELEKKLHELENKLKKEKQDEYCRNDSVDNHDAGVSGGDNNGGDIAYQGVAREARGNDK